MLRGDSWILRLFLNTALSWGFNSLLQGRSLGKSGGKDKLGNQRLSLFSPVGGEVEWLQQSILLGRGGGGGVRIPGW